MTKRERQPKDIFKELEAVGDLLTAFGYETENLQMDDVFTLKREILKTLQQNQTIKKITLNT